MVGSNAIAIHPLQSSATTVTIAYARFAPALTADGQSPDIPAEDHHLIAEGAAAIIAGTKLGGQGDSTARQRLESFFSGIKRRADWVRERNRTNRFEALPAEVSKEALKKLLENFK
jgi:UDP-N-acetylmuramate-alanine ligase